MNTESEEELAALALGDNYHDNDCESGEIRFYCKCRERGAERVLAYLTPVRSAEQDKAAEEARQHAECDKFKEQYHEQWMLTARELEAVEARIASMEELLNDWEHSLAVFGPVDGTGRPDPDGMLMVDVSREGLIADLRRALAPPQDRPEPRPRSSRRGAV